MSVAAIQPPTAIFREEQNFSWWVYAALVGLTTLGLGWTVAVRPDAAVGAGFGRLDVPLGVVLGVLLPVVLVVGVLRMTTEVRPGEVLVWFGWVPSYRRRINLAAVAAVEPVQYRPLTHCGGWGIRRGRDGERVLNARGDRGVRLRFQDGSRLLIGSQQPEALARAIEEAMRPVP